MYFKWSSLRASAFFGVELTFVKYRTYKRFIFASLWGNGGLILKLYELKHTLVTVLEVLVCSLCRVSWGTMQECETIFRKLKDGMEPPKITLKSSCQHFLVCFFLSVWKKKHIAWALFSFVSFICISFKIFLTTLMKIHIIKCACLCI